jgi:hypothetical protein
MPDMSSHDATRPDELHTMTLSELEARLAAAGVLISRRQLMYAYALSSAGIVS